MHLDREVVKYVRDRAKAKYKLSTECEICGIKNKLELHHYNTLSLLVERWLLIKKYKPEDVLDWRDEFIQEHKVELFEDVVTLCNFHHQQRLHNIYGQAPALITASKQANWVRIEREKHGKLV